jgi:hypothetical protein
VHPPSARSRTERSGVTDLAQEAFSHEIETDNLDYAFLVSVQGSYRMRIGVVQRGEVVGERRFARLRASHQRHVFSLLAAKLPEWFNHVGDAVQDDVIDWIGENIHGDWSVHGSVLNDNVTTEFSFAESTDAVAFKLRWIDRIATG